MTLSIITINYNNAEGLRKTLASVASQTYPHIEHIIVDGGSKDGSVEILRAYPQPLPKRRGEITEDKFPTQNPAHKVLWISEKDNGIYNAMNKGIRMATGDYIQILNSGDILAAPDVTERMMAALQNKIKQQHQQHNINNPSVVEQHTTTASENNTSSLYQNRPAILYGNMIKEYPDGHRVKDTCGGGDYTPESFLYFYRGTLNHDCAYIRGDLFEKYGLYNEQMKICSDWEWYVRTIVLGGEKACYTDIDVTIFDMMGVSESGGKNRALIQQERREYLEAILPASVLRDYDKYAFPIEQYQRLKKYHLWGLVYLVERMIFKFEKWLKK
ncbi:MAG: glycosyltransferase [Paludibacteraceae bacterium]|nr:glycosyltransferase [Paludibacteraceae bacterium]